MKIAVLDLEHNPPSKNIFQIGAVLCSTKEKTIDIMRAGFSKHCRLPEGEILNPEVAKLCNVSDEFLLDKGVSFKAGVQYFWDWFSLCSCGGRIAAWGSDVWELKQQSIAAGVAPPDKLYVLNIKEMGKVIRAACGGRYKGGLVEYLEYFGLKFEGQQHDALADSFNTAKLLIRWTEMISRYSELERTFSKNIEWLGDL